MAEHPAGEHNLLQLDRLMTFFFAHDVLDEWVAWWHQERAKAGYDGLSGAQIMDWVRSAHPELAAQVRRILRS